MRKSPLLSARYARAFFEACDGKIDLAALSARLGEGAFLSAPVLPYAELCAKLGGEPGEPETRNLLRLLSRRKRHRLLPEIIEAYVRHVEARAGISHASVTTVVEPAGDAIERIRGFVARLTGAKTVKLDVRTDPKILGGIVIRVGDNLVDGSLSTRIDNFRARFQN